MSTHTAEPVPAQFYLAAQLHPSPALNTVSWAVRIEGPVDVSRLRGALRDVVMAQAALRTRLDERDGEVSCHIAEDAPQDLLGVEDAPLEEWSLERAVESMRGSLSPQRQPWRACWVRHAPESSTFVFCAHRCIWDERSTQLLADGLSRSYGGMALSAANKAKVKDKGTRSGRGAMAGTAGSAADELLQRFSRGMEGAPSVHAFPLAAARTGSAPEHSAEQILALPTELVDGLSDVGASLGVDDFLPAAALLGYTFAQFAGQDGVTLGLPFDLRADADGQAMGSHTAMVPVHLDTSTGSFAALCQRLVRSYQSSRDYAALPYTSLVKACGARTEPGINPLFQIGLAREAPTSLQLAGCRCTDLAVPPPPQRVDFFLRVGPRQIGLAYASGLVAEPMVERFDRSFLSLARAAVAQPESPLARLPLLDDDDQKALALAAHACDEPEYLGRDLFAELSRHAVEGNAKAALICGATTLSYAELHTAIESMAQRLAEAGMGAGSLVGVCLPRSVDMVVAMLAVLRSGAAYVPLDPAFPRERLAQMLRHSKLAAVVTTRGTRELLGAEPCARIEIDDGRAPAPIAVAPATVAPAAPAYVIYTSGSTGTPKGVAVPRSAAINFLLSMLERPGLRSQDVWCAVTTLSFDIAFLELMGPLCAGATVVVATEEEARDARLLAELLAQQHVSVLQATPVTWQMLLSSGWRGDRGLKALCGGEALTPALARALAPVVAELWNMYGPTETTVWSTCERIVDPERPISVGTAIHNTALYVLDAERRPVPRGVEGRLFIAGDGCAIGYLHDAELTAQRFPPDPFRGAGRMYDTGDRARFDDEGRLFVLGRSDFQVKIRGFRIELGEIEARLSLMPSLESVVADVLRDDPANPELVAYFTLKPGSTEAPAVADMRAHCAATLPAHMVPSRFRCLDAMPRTPNGKVDRKRLPGFAPAVATAAPATAARPSGEVERVVMEVLCSVLGISSAGMHESFFDLGGTSIAAVSVAREIGKRLGMELSVLRVFEHPTAASLARFIQNRRTEVHALQTEYERGRQRRSRMRSPTDCDVAIVGAAGRFPGARNLDELWENLRAGRETVTTWAREDLDPLVPARDRNDPHYIPTRGVLADIDLFDAGLFGISPSEAELMDPQLRVFMEVAWEAFENAGYLGESVGGPVGVWAGMGNNFYYHYNVLTRPDKLATMGEIAAEIANEKDHIAPRVSHKLNLRGPSLSVHAACSTSLVVIENAYQALISHQVDMALAGGIDIRTPQKSGQRHEEGGVFSVDGHCRPFDAAATGTMFGEGAGAVVLKRLDDAVRDNDTVLAVIRGAAVNHDGGHKVSYLAPSVEGQSRLVASALGLADIHPDTLSFIEAHGTATPIGDPIEVEALTRVFRAFTERRRYCAIGSIKGNFGHATTAAGIAGLLKVVLALRHRQLPATLHFRTPNPRIDFGSSPFYVSNKLMDWKSEGHPRRAGVSSFGFCGTNAHIVLEEAPQAPATEAPTRAHQLFLLSARNKAALDEMSTQLGQAVAGLDPAHLADAAYTTQVGRKRMEHRRCVVVVPGADPAASFAQPSGPRSASARSEMVDPGVALLFPGQGAQYINMGRSLYAGESVYRESVDRCAALLAPHLGVDLRGFLFPEASDEERATESLNNTFYTQPAIFTVAYSLAQQLRSFGVRPTTYLGHSIGEFVAATLAGVMELEDALRLVAIRGRLMRDLPRGSMLTVRQAATTLAPQLPNGVDIAAVNGPELTVVAGPTPLLTELAATLSAADVANRMLHTSHAFHSSMMEPIVDTFLHTVEKVKLSEPNAAMVSTVTGDWVQPGQFTDPGYWARHLRSPVLFSKAVQLLLADENLVLMECGPRRTCSSLALQHRPRRPERVLGTLPDSADPTDEIPSLLLALGGLWMNGVSPDWAAVHGGQKRRRVALPAYAFQRKRYWIDPGATAAALTSSDPAALSGAASLRTPSTAPSDAKAGTAAAPAADDLMSQLRRLIEGLVGNPLEDFDEHTPFLMLGLDSLLLTQLARAVRAQLGLETSFRDLVEKYSSPHLLVTALSQQRPTTTSAATTTTATTAAATTTTAAANKASLPSVPVGRDPFAPAAAQRFPLTPGQAYWRRFRDGAGARTRVGKEILLLRLHGELHQDALERALKTLPMFHEALRGRIDGTSESFLVDGALDAPIERQDLSGLPAATRSAREAELIQRLNAEPFDLERGPLCRFALVKTSATDCVVLLMAHQAVCDGWSMDVVLADLARLYSGFVGAAPLPAPPHGVADYFKSRTGEAFLAREAASRSYWAQTLQRASTPSGQGAPASHPLVHATRALPAELVAHARTWARQRGVSFFAVLLATFRSVLQRAAPERALHLTVPIAGHPECGLEDCVGPLAANLPISVGGQGSESLELASSAVFKSLLDAQEHSAFEPAAVADAPASTSPPSLAAHFSHVQKYTPEKLSFAGLDWNYEPVPHAFGDRPVSLLAFESSSEVVLTLSASSESFHADWPVLRLADFEALLASSLQAPQTPMSTFDLSLRGAAPVNQAPGAARGGAAVDDKARDPARVPIIVPLQKGAEGAVPVFCLFGIQLYVDLAKALGPETPVVAMHIPMVYTPARDPRPSLEEVVQHYVRAVREIRPHGPYIFAGLCYGGIVSFEVARALQRQGEEIRLVAVLDALLPHGRHVDQSVRARELARGLMSSPWKTASASAEHLRTAGAARLMALPFTGGVARALLRKGWSSEAKEPIDLAVDGPEARADVAVFAQGRPYLGSPIMVFRATGLRRAPWESVDQDLGWRSLAAQVQAVDVECEHLDIVRPPNVQLVAEGMRRAVSR